MFMIGNPIIPPFNLTIWKIYKDYYYCIITGFDHYFN